MLLPRHDHWNHAADHEDHDCVDHEDHDRGDPSAAWKCYFLAVPALPISVTQNGPTFGPLIQHQKMQFVKYYSGTLSAVENPLSVLLWSSPVTMSCVTLNAEVLPWALIFTLLHVQLPKPAVRAPVLPCKHLLLGVAASKTLGFLFYGVLLAEEGLLTFLLLLHKAPASPVAMLALAPLQHNALGGLGVPSWECPGMAELSAWAASSAPIHASVSLTAAPSGFWAPWSSKGSANFPLFLPVHAPKTALPKDLLLSGPFGSILGLYLLFLLCWGYQGCLQPTRCGPALLQIWEVAQSFL